MNLEYKETQKFSQWWLWLILLASVGFMAFKTYQQMFLGVQDGNIPMSNGILIALTVLLFTILILFGRMQLNTYINQSEINIHFIPFSKKRILWKDVKKAEVVNYGFVGGWGFRFWTKHGRVYNTGGDTGLSIELNNGEKYLVGTQKAAELTQYLESIKPYD